MKKEIIGKAIAFAVSAAMVLSMGITAFGASYIGESAAVSKALKNAGTTRSAVWDIECDRDKDDGVTVYEVEFKRGARSTAIRLMPKPAL